MLAWVSESFSSNRGTYVDPSPDFYNVKENGCGLKYQYEISLWSVSTDMARQIMYS